MGKIGDLLIAVVFGNLCKLLYALVKQAYNLLYSIANTTLFTGTEAGSIGGFAHNIYTILGVIMMFKLAFSLVSYIVNPDAMSDKNNGLGSVLKNVVIVVGLTLLVPIIFTQAMKLQRIILKEDIIGRIVTGVAKTGGSTMDESAGKTMAFNLLAGFVQPNENVTACNDVTSIMMGSDKAAQTACFDAITDSDAKSAFANAWTNSDTNELMSMKLLTATDSDDKLIFDFDWLVAPLVGGFTAYILILFCIDTAVRSIKLAFLQLLAPVPIVSYIDPKGQKGIFNKWVNMCVSTYLDLFIRLAAIYFAIYIIQVVINGGQMQTVNATGDGYDQPSFFVKVFMVLGCLMFAKQVPDIIKEFTGKAMGDFTLNPMKKIGAGAGVVAGAGIGAVGGAAAAFNASKAIGDGNGKKLVNTLRGAVGGAGRGTVAGFKSKGVGVYGAASKVAGTTGANIYNNAGTHFGDRMVAGMQKKFGIDTEADKIDKKNVALKNLASYKDKLKSQANFDTKNRGFNYTYTDSHGGLHSVGTAGSTKNFKQHYDDLVNSGQASADEITNARTAWETSQKLSISDGAMTEIKSLKNQMAADVADNASYVDGVNFNGTYVSGISATSSYDDINNATVALQNEQVNDVSTDKYRQSKKTNNAIAGHGDGKK